MNEFKSAPFYQKKTEKASGKENPQEQICLKEEINSKTGSIHVQTLSTNGEKDLGNWWYKEALSNKL